MQDKRGVFEFAGVSKMKFEIRKARQSDAKEIARLYLQFWDSHKKIDPLLEFKELLTLENQITAAKKDLKKKNNCIFVAVNNSRVIGFIEFFIKKNAKVFGISQYGYLNSAVTDKSFRKLGVVKQLYSAAAIFLKRKGINYVKTNVYLSNKSAVKVWKRIGFMPQSYTLIKKIR